MPTRQETFDRVAKHLLTQNYKCEEIADDSSSACLYRDGKGGMCAAGCLIPDDKYDPKMEYEAVVQFDGDDNSLLGMAAKVILEEGHDIALVGQLQSIHDNQSVADWRYHLRELANKEGLIFNG